MHKMLLMKMRWFSDRKGTMFLEPFTEDEKNKNLFEYQS